jgi:TetR/AcrR family transcriptional regulator
LAEQPKDGAAAKRSRDPSVTIKRILAAAREEFGANGFDGAKMEHIARRAKVSKQLVYLYFQSKSELYGELLRNISRSTYEQLLAIDYAALDPKEAIRTYIGAVFDRFRTDAATAIMTLDQSLHDGAQIRLAPDARRLHDALAKKLDEALERGKATGVFGSHVDVSGLEFMTVIIVSGCISSRGMFMRHLGSSAFEDDSPAFWRDYAANFILRALRA